MKFFLLIVFIVLISCTKQKEDDSVCATTVIYVNGKEVKRVTGNWYSNQDLSVRDTVLCLNGEMIVTFFHKCEK